MRAGWILPWLAVAAGCGSDDTATRPLPALGASAGVTVSGISAGAYMAGQYHVAYADSVAGAGLLAGGPWGCAGGELERALGPCIGGEGLDAGALQAGVAALAEQGAIDAPAALAHDRVWLFHGAADSVVDRAVTTAAADFYRGVAPDADVTIVTDVPAAHGWPTDGSGGACGEMAAPFVNDCGYDAAGELLRHLYPDLAAPTTPAARLERFDQSPFAAASMADEGFLYVPPKCRQGSSCGIHVVFHGCRQSIGQVGDGFAAQAGFLRHADANDLVILFPQAKASSVAPMNPLACWDWWGYSGDDYLERDGAQLAAVRAMIEQLAGTE